MTEVLFAGQYFSLERDDDGVEWVRCADEVLVVPLTAAGEAILTVEPAAALGQATLLLPGGAVEPGESPLAAANRELQEEIGLRAARLDWLGELHPFSKYLTVRSQLYLGRDLSPSRLVGDEGYAIGQERVGLDGFEALIAAGRLRDARTIAGLCLARHYIGRE